jgi:hypothetical protein
MIFSRKTGKRGRGRCHKFGALNNQKIEGRQRVFDLRFNLIDFRREKSKLTRS